MGVQLNSPMPVVVDTPSRILLRHNARGALVFGVVMAAAGVGAVRFIPDGPRFLIAGVCGLFAAILALFAFYREELLIDLASRQWRRRSGFAGSVQETRGGLDELREVALTLRRSRPNDDEAPRWDVTIQAPGWKSWVVLESHTREEAGYAALEKWAQRLRLEAVDRSGEREVRTRWDGLDAPVRERGGPAAGATDSGDDAEVPAALARAYGAAPAGAAPSAHPAAGSRLLVARESGRQRIVLPPIGWNGGASFVVVFGLVFGGFGSLAMLVGLHVIQGVRVNGEIPDGPVWGFAAGGAFFALIGFGLIAAMIVGTRAREFIDDGPDRLIVATTWGGRTWGRKPLLKREIEGVDLSLAPRSGTARRFENDPRPAPVEAALNDVRIRTDTRVVRLGRSLPEPDQRWLRDTLERWARG